MMGAIHSASRRRVVLAPPSDPIPFGSTNQTATLRDEEILLYLRRPTCANPGNGFFVIWHGTNRNSDNYILHGTDWCNARCIIGVAPTMDSTRFPTSDYQLGGLYPPNSSTIRPSSEWIVNYSQAVVDWGRQREARPTMPVWQFGHSAGGQFLSRVAAYACPPGMQRILVTNPSSHVRATLSYNAPYGFGGLPQSLNPTQMLQNYLAQPITIYNGGDDDDPNDPDLSHADGADAQGTNRLARANFVWDEAVNTANTNGWTFNWRKVVAPGVAHDAYDMMHAPEMATAWAP